MVLHNILFLLAIVLYISSAFHFYRVWKDIKKLTTSDTLTKELSVNSRKRLRLALFLFVIGIVLSTISTFI